MCLGIIVGESQYSYLETIVCVSVMGHPFKMAVAFNLNMQLLI